MDVKNQKIHSHIRYDTKTPVPLDMFGTAEYVLNTTFDAKEPRLPHLEVTNVNLIHTQAKTAKYTHEESLIYSTGLSVTAKSGGFSSQNSTAFDRQYPLTKDVHAENGNEAMELEAPIPQQYAPRPDDASTDSSEGIKSRSNSLTDPTAGSVYASIESINFKEAAFDSQYQMRLDNASSQFTKRQNRAKLIKSSPHQDKIQEAVKSYLIKETAIVETIIHSGEFTQMFYPGAPNPVVDFVFQAAKKDRFNCQYRHLLLRTVDDKPSIRGIKGLSSHGAKLDSSYFALDDVVLPISFGDEKFTVPGLSTEELSNSKFLAILDYLKQFQFKSLTIMIFATSQASTSKVELLLSSTNSLNPSQISPLTQDFIHNPDQSDEALFEFLLSKGQGWRRAILPFIFRDQQTPQGYQPLSEHVGCKIEIIQVDEFLDKHPEIYAKTTEKYQNASIEKLTLEPTSDIFLHRDVRTPTCNEKKSSSAPNSPNSLHQVDDHSPRSPLGTNSFYKKYTKEGGAFDSEFIQLWPNDRLAHDFIEINCITDPQKLSSADLLAKLSLCFAMLKKISIEEENSSSPSGYLQLNNTVYRHTPMSRLKSLTGCRQTVVSRIIQLNDIFFQMSSNSNTDKGLLRNTFVEMFSHSRDVLLDYGVRNSIVKYEEALIAWGFMDYLVNNSLLNLDQAEYWIDPKVSHAETKKHIESLQKDYQSCREISLTFRTHPSAPLSMHL